MICSHTSPTHISIFIFFPSITIHYITNSFFCMDIWNRNVVGKVQHRGPTWGLCHVYLDTLCRDVKLARDGATSQSPTCFSSSNCHWLFLCLVFRGRVGMHLEKEGEGFVFLLQCAAGCSRFTAACSLPAVPSKALLHLHRPKLAVHSLTISLVLFLLYSFHICRLFVNPTCACRKSFRARPQVSTRA